MTITRQRTLTLVFTPQFRSILPKGSQHLKGPKFQQVVSKIIRDLMDNLGGLIKTMSVEDDVVKIEWEQTLPEHDNLEAIVGLLKKRRYLEAVLLMELLLSDEPDQLDYLYNLGMAYSDMGDIQRAIDILTRLIDIEPRHTNARVALGVAFMRSNQEGQAIKELQIAITQDPNNPWAHRNLGAALAKQEKFIESLPYLRRSIELNPDDQVAWYGLGQALEMTNNFDGADEAYRKVLDLDEFSQIADLSRSARSGIAQKNFRSAVPNMERLDAVMYCLGALDKFKTLSLAEVQKIGFEIAILGTRGINVNDLDTSYTLRSLPGNFTGLHLLCLEYVAFKKLAPEQDIGFDLSAEYRSALTLFESNKTNK